MSPEHRRATVAELHGLDPFQEAGPVPPRVWWCDPVDAALVLGSRQPISAADAETCAAAGLTVTRRRSGGGAVLVDANVIWVDLVLPHGIAPDDVRGAMYWAGERWLEAFDATSPTLRDRITIHTGGMVDTDWSEFVCFAGVGPGELLVDGRKLVGLSQRRTRAGLRIQGMAYRARPTVDVATLLTGPLPPSPVPLPATTAEAGLAPDVDGPVVANALHETLQRWPMG